MKCSPRCEHCALCVNTRLYSSDASPSRFPGLRNAATHLRETMNPDKHSDYGYNQLQETPSSYDSVSAQPKQLKALGPTALVHPPSDCLAFSIFVTCCCCFPFGLYAVVRSIECRAAARNGDRALAKKASRDVRISNLLGFFIGLIILIIVIIFEVHMFNVYFKPAMIAASHRVSQNGHV